VRPWRPARIKVQTILQPFEPNVSFPPTLYCDDDVLAVAKPEGMATIPERHPAGDSLVEQLATRLASRLYVVHRLDKDVSGVVVLAKHADAHRCLNDQFAARKVSKTYLALTHGRVPPDEGEIDFPLRQFGSGRMGVDRQGGKPSLSRFAVVRRCDAFSLLTVDLITGRRHQIRVHLYAMGHPIVGDRRYGDIAVQRQFPRLLLHARQIAFLLPSGRRVCIVAPPPPSFERLVRHLCPEALPAMEGG